MAKRTVVRGEARRQLLQVSALALVIAGGVARAASAQEPGDGDEVVWAGDAAWSTPAQEPVPAQLGPDQGVPPPQDQSGQWSDGSGQGYDNPEPSYGGDRYPAAETYAPRYADFREGLAPYGQWVDTPEYGRVWRPTQVSSDWRPYLDGRWVYTSYGWTWVAQEPFGWATYHYGRWWYSPAYGWTWLPGRVWAPAWVSWRYGAGNAGWAPLGPRGIVYREPTRWVFVDTAHFDAPIRRYALPAHRTYALWNRVQALPLHRPGLYAGPPPAVVSRAVGHTISAVPVRVASSHAEASRPEHIVGGPVHIYRPVGVPFKPAAAGNRAGPRATPQAPQRTESWTPRAPREAPRTGPSHQGWQRPIAQEQRPDRSRQIPVAQPRPYQRNQQPPTEAPRALQQGPRPMPGGGIPRTTQGRPVQNHPAPERKADRQDKK